MAKPARLRLKRPLELAPWLILGVVAALWPRQPAQNEPPPMLSEPRLVSPEVVDKEEPFRGRAAERILHIPYRGWRDILWRTMLEINRDRLPIVAGGVTFYALLSLFPMLSAFVTLYGLVADLDQVWLQIQRLSAILPPGVLDLVGQQMIRLAASNDSALSLTFITSLMLAIWSANAGMNALFDGMNIAYGEAETRGFLRRRALTLGSTAAAIVIITALAFLLIGLPLWLGRFGLAPADVWWGPFRWVAALCMVAGGMAALYRYGPSRARARWGWIWLGAVLASGAWLIGSMAFSTYVSRFANYEDVYGPLGIFIGFMVWIWFTAIVILLGAELNAEVEHQTACDTTTGAPAPMGQRGAAVADSIGLMFRGLDEFGWVGQQGGKIWTRLRKTSDTGA